MAQKQCLSELLQGCREKALELEEKRHFNKLEELYTELINRLNTFEESQDRMKILALAYNDRGLSKYKQVSFDEAVEDYDIALKLDPTLAAAYYNRGTVYYRLCKAGSIEKSIRLESLDKAMEDFTQASNIEQNNPEFELAKQSCCDEADLIRNGDGNAFIKKANHGTDIEWSKIPTSKKVKLLFALDNGDKTIGKTEEIRKLNTSAVEEVNAALLSFLKNEKNIADILDVLKKRVKNLLEYPFINIPGNTKAANLSVRKMDEDLLTFVEVCQFLGIECDIFDNKKELVQEKLYLTDMECKGSFAIYAENLRILHICDQLTCCQVFELLEIVKNDENLKKLVENPLNISLAILQKVEGLKEALFLYIIRLLEVNDKLNRIYTDKLEDLLSQLCKDGCDDHEEQKLKEIISSLSAYPDECQPTGHCVVFCVTKDRDGADVEMAKIRQVFEHLGYTVTLKENPTYDTVNEYLQELAKEKYRFYDSIVFWFVSHGLKSKIVLADGEMYESKDIIDGFCKLDNFRMKPKIFFMTSCQGRTTISVKKEGGLKVTVDGAAGGTTSGVQFTNIPEEFCNITAVYYEMDRLIANATLPDKFAFRVPKEGSSYVDIVCRLLEEHRGHNITQVLELACNKMHQILFSCSTGKNFEGEAKQGCCYESTFQKTFNVPRGKE